MSGQETVEALIVGWWALLSATRCRPGQCRNGGARDRAPADRAHCRRCSRWPHIGVAGRKRRHRASHGRVATARTGGRADRAGRGGGRRRRRPGSITTASSMARGHSVSGSSKHELPQGPAACVRRPCGAGGPARATKCRRSPPARTRRHAPSPWFPWQGRSPHPLVIGARRPRIAGARVGSHRGRSLELRSARAHHGPAA